MNNKLIARIAAVAISASLLSTVAFAADPTLTVADDTATLSFKVGEGNADVTISSEDQITMMAYLVDGTVETPAAIPDYTNQTVVALNQVAGATGFGDVLIAASKLEAGKKIAVVLGGSDGTTEKYLIAQEVIDNKVVVTVMNGATAIDVEADADGNVTLPADTAFNGTGLVSGYNLTLYSWVAVTSVNATTGYPVEGTEYLAGTKVAAVDLKDVTLYAKYVCDMLIGDVDASDSFTTTDASAIKYKVLGKFPTLQKNVGKALFDGSYVIIGDVDATGTFTTTDASAIKYNVLGKFPTLQKNVGKTMYVVNKVAE